MTQPGVLVVLIVLAGLGLCIAVRHPLLGVAIVPLAAGKGNEHVNGVPFDIHVEQVAVMVAIGIVCLHLLLVTEPRIRPPHRVAASAMQLIVLFAMTTAAASVFSLAPARFLGVSISMILGCAYCLALVICVRHTDDVVVLLGAFLAGSVLVNFPALSQIGAVQSELAGTVIMNRPTGGFNDPNELGVFAAVSVVLSLSMLSVARRKPAICLAMVAAAVASLALLASFSRGSWMAVLPGVALLATFPSARKRCIRVFAPTLLVGFAVSPMLGLSLPTSAISDRLGSVLGSSVNPYDVRPIIWQEAIDFIWQRPVLGWGPGTFEQLSATPPSTIWAYPVRHAHNGLLTTLTEVGVVGALIAVVLAATVAVGLTRVIRGGPDTTGRGRGLATGVLAALTVFGGHLVADYGLRNPVVLMSMWCVAGLAIAVVNVSGREVPAPVIPEPAVAHV